MLHILTGNVGKREGLGYSHYFHLNACRFQRNLGKASFTFDAHFPINLPLALPQALKLGIAAATENPKTALFRRSSSLPLLPLRHFPPNTIDDQGENIANKSTCFFSYFSGSNNNPLKKRLTPLASPSFFSIPLLCSSHHPLFFRWRAT